MAAADGVDARARRVAARLLSTRSRRHGAAHWTRRGGGPAASARHQAGGHPAGAARLVRALRALEADGWVSLAQVARPGSSPDDPRLDHVVIGPGGVVVIESHSWVGRVEVSRGALQQNGFWRERETAAVAQSAGCLAAMLLPQHRTAVHAFICVAQHDLAEQVVPPGVHVVGVSGLGRALRALPQRLHPAEVLHLNTVLRHVLVESPAPEQLTTAALLDHPVGPTGLHREPLLGRPPGLFVPVDGASLRSAARTARRQRPRAPWWRTPRVAVPRVLLAVVLLAITLLAGPAVVRSVQGSVGGGPVPTLLPGPPGGPVDVDPTTQVLPAATAAARPGAVPPTLKG